MSSPPLPNTSEGLEENHSTQEMTRSLRVTTPSPPPASVRPTERNLRRPSDRHLRTLSQSSQQSNSNSIPGPHPSSIANGSIVPPSQTLLQQRSTTPVNSADDRVLQNVEIVGEPTRLHPGESEPPSPSRRRLSRDQLSVRVPTDPLQPMTQTSLATALESPGADPDERPKPLPQRDMSLGFDPPRTHRDGLMNKGGLASVAAKVWRGKANEYEYSKLEQSDTIRIRILRIDPATENEPIICSLIPSSLDDDYEALSYVWGSDEPTEEIKIRDAKPTGNNRRNMIPVLRERSFYVRPNLYAALKNFPSRKVPVDMWIDALCMDQENDEEKEIQVAMMEEIYSKANRVLIWLGIPEPGPSSATALAFDCISQMCDLSLFDALTTDAENWPLLEALGKLMKNAWFSRRWVVQELALAKQVTVHCGSYKINWIDFADAIAFYVKSYDRIKKFIAAPNRPKPIPEVQRLGPSVLVDATSNLFRRSDENEITEHRQTLEALVSSLTAYEASDPRDTIYAVLSLAKDSYRAQPGQSASDIQRCQLDRTMGHGLRPEYEKDVFEVCKDFIQSCVHRPYSPSLDIICRHWAPLPRKFTKLEAADVLKKINLDDKNWLYERKLASWMPSIKEAAFGTPKAAISGRVNGDSLVGIPPDRPFYNATPGCVLEVSFGMTEEDPSIRDRRNRAKADISPISVRSVSDGTMSVRGVQLDTIDTLSQHCDEGTIYYECLEIGKWDEERPTEVPDPLWRTMVADRGPGGAPAPSWYKRACRHAIAQRTPNNNDVKIKDLISDGSESLGVEFLKRVRDVTWNRKFFSTRIEDRLGLAPRKAREGDIVCIFYGCSVPVLLRKIRNREEYEFVGECYLHGMMDGEAVSIDRKEWLRENERIFVLR